MSFETQQAIDNEYHIDVDTAILWLTNNRTFYDRCRTYLFSAYGLHRALSLHFNELVRDIATERDLDPTLSLMYWHNMDLTVSSQWFNAVYNELIEYYQQDYNELMQARKDNLKQVKVGGHS